MLNSQQKENFQSSIEKQTIKSFGDSESISLLKTTTQTDNLKVVIRVRPALQREMESDAPFRSIVLFKK